MRSAIICGRLMASSLATALPCGLRSAPQTVVLSCDRRRARATVARYPRLVPLKEPCRRDALPIRRHAEEAWARGSGRLGAAGILALLASSRLRTRPVI